MNFVKKNVMINNTNNTNSSNNSINTNIPMNFQMTNQILHQQVKYHFLNQKFLEKSGQCEEKYFKKGRDLEKRREKNQNKMGS